MKIQYASDLHLEFEANSKFLSSHSLQPNGDVLLLAGDILPFSLHAAQTSFIDFVADNFELVLWIPGNHEYYHHDLTIVADPLAEKLRSNVWLVNNTVIPYKEINFICSTLWSKINAVNALDIQRSVSDFFAINLKNKKLTTYEFNALHRNSVSFLEKALAANAAAKNVIVTHHVPTLLHYPAKYRNSPLNEAFVTELHDFIYDCNAAFWIYGHHHTNTPDFSIGNTTMLTNQFGYVHKREHLGFRRDACFEM